ncbi:MAG: RagB/SusD family nutrient uptake outer membrane protein, partial [Bacteroidota bacterium]
VHFRAIRDANVVLDNINNEAFSADFITKTTAEANFIRGYSYAELYYLFGALPLYQSAEDDPLLGRSSDVETTAFIEQELTAAVANLPEDAPFGRATRGAAQGILCKFYLNTKQWQRAADVAQQIISSGKYQLMDSYTDVFAIANEGNAELLWALTKSSGSPTTAQAVNALMFPPDYPRPFPNNGVFAARTYVFDSFIDSFEPTDERLNFMVQDFVSSATGETVQGYGNDQTFPHKYEFDPQSAGFQAGNDFPLVRYADILLARAEALNEISGPNQESIDLINQVRTRANATPISLGDFGGQEVLRAAILQERGWEFYFEMKSREDYIRHGVFISNAQARGKNAQPHHVLFPIPQVEIDANDALEQNPSY